MKTKSVQNKILTLALLLGLIATLTLSVSLANSIHLSHANCLISAITGGDCSSISSLITHHLSGIQSLIRANLSSANPEILIGILIIPILILKTPPAPPQNKLLTQEIPENDTARVSELKKFLNWFLNIFKPYPNAAARARMLV